MSVVTALRIWQKLGLLVVLTRLTMLATICPLVKQKNAGIRFARQEIVGTQYLAAHGQRRAEGDEARCRASSPTSQC